MNSTSPNFGRTSKTPANARNVVALEKHQQNIIVPKDTLAGTAVGGRNQSETRRRERLVKVSIKKGKRTIADKVYNQAKVQRRNLGYKNPTNEIEKCIEILSPMVTIRSEVRSGQSIQVPAARSRELQYGKSVRILRESALSETQVATSSTIGNAAVSQSRELTSRNLNTQTAGKWTKQFVPTLSSDDSNTYRRVQKSNNYHKGVANRIASTIVKVIERNPGSSAIDKRNTLHRTAISQLSALR